MRCTCGYPIPDVLDDTSCDCGLAELDARREQRTLRWATSALLDAKEHDAGIEEMEELWARLRIALEGETR